MRADSLEDAARALARKVATVPQRESHFVLAWRNNSSLTEERSQMLRQYFTGEFGSENLVEKQESGTHPLQVSIEETPTFYVLVASVPTSSGDLTRISRFARAAIPSADLSGATRRLLKELIWQQQEPILDAAELSDDQNKPGPLLILDRDSLSLYRHENDRWELQDTKRIPIAEKPMRAPRGEIRISSEGEKHDSVLLPDQICDLAVTEKMDLNCRKAPHPWREGMLLASPCDRNVWWLRPEQEDWSASDRLLLRNPSLPKSAPSAAELELPGPSLSLSSGRRMQSDTSVVFNLATGNYEVYRITLACAN